MKPRVTSDPVARSQAILLSGQVGRLLLFVLTITLLGRRLSPSEFGFVALISTFFLVGQEILDMGTTSVTTRQVAQDPHGENTALACLLAWRRWLGLALGLFALALLPVMEKQIGGAGQQVVFLVAALALPWLHLKAYYVVFQARQHFEPAVAVGLVGQAAFIGGTLAVLHFWPEHGLASMSPGQAVALLVVVREILVLVASRSAAIHLLGERIHAAWLDPGIGALVRRAGAFGFAGLCYKLSALGGTFFVWATSSPEVLGQFNAVQRLLGPVSEASWMFATPLLASLSVLVRNDAAAMRGCLRGQTQLLLSISAMVIVAAPYVAQPLLHLLYGSTYDRGALSAVPVLVWSSAAAACVLLTPVLTVAALAQGRERELLAVSLGGLGVSIIANARWVPIDGALGAARALCASEAIILAALAMSTVRRGDLRLDPGWLVFLVPATLLWPLLATFDGNPWAQLTCTAIALPASVLLLRRLAARRVLRALRSSGAGE